MRRRYETYDPLWSEVRLEKTEDERVRIRARQNAGLALPAVVGLSAQDFTESSDCTHCGVVGRRSMAGKASRWAHIGTFASGL